MVLRYSNQPLRRTAVLKTMRLPALLTMTPGSRLPSPGFTQPLVRTVLAPAVLT